MVSLFFLFLGLIEECSIPGRSSSPSSKKISLRDFSCRFFVTLEKFFSVNFSLESFSGFITGFEIPFLPVMDVILIRKLERTYRDSILTLESV
jgi:hypothetical protein